MNQKFKEVLFIGPEKDYGGIGAVLDIYATNIPHFKFIPTYPSFQSGTKGFMHKLYAILFFCKAIVKYIYTLLTDTEIKIVHIHSASNGSFIRKSVITHIGRMFNKRIIFHIHSGNFKNYYLQAGYLKKYIIYTLKKSDKVICLSEEWLKYYTNELHLSNVIIVPNPVEMQIKSIPQNQQSTIQLLFLGKICKEKGIFDLINYLENDEWFQKGFIELTIAGNGEIDKLQHILVEKKITEKIKYIGWIRNQQKENVIRACDIFILPSYFEGVPISILECMSAGKPIIATNVGGIPSLVKNNYNGWLFQPGEFSMLKPIFNEIFSHKNYLKQYGENAWKTAQHYNPDEIISILNNTYKELIPNLPNIQRPLKNYIF